MKFILSAFELWKLAIINDKPNYWVCRHRAMFWDALNGLLYIHNHRYIALKGSIFEEPNIEDLVQALRKT